MATFDQFSPQEPPQPPKSRGKSCLVISLIVAGVCLVLCAGVCGGFFFIGVRTIKEQPAYKMALSQVQQAPEVTERLGQPVEEAGFMPSVQISTTNDQGSATMNFDVKGPKGQAHVHSEARMIGNTWGLTLLEVTFADGERITLDTGGKAEDEAPKWTPPGQDAGTQKPAEGGEAPNIEVKPPADSPSQETAPGPPAEISLPVPK